MCLAVPGKILAIAGDDPIMRVGRVDFGGIVSRWPAICSTWPIVAGGTRAAS